MNITLEAGQVGVELFRRRESDICHCLASKNFDFATGSEAEMLAGKYYVTTICGETYKYGKYSIFWIARTSRREQIRNACELCFFN